MSHLLCTSIIQAISSTVLPVQGRRVLVALGLYTQHVENGLLIHGALPTSCRSASVSLSRSTCGRSTVFDMHGHMPMHPWHPNCIRQWLWVSKGRRHDGITWVQRMDHAIKMVFIAVLFGSSVLIHCRQGKHRSGATG